MAAAHVARTPRERDPNARVLLVDAVGELGAWWGTAQIAFVGGSLGNRGGQNMIEPAAYGAAVSFGPNTWNFRDIVAAMLARQAAVVVRDAAGAGAASCAAAWRNRRLPRRWASVPGTWWPSNLGRRSGRCGFWSRWSPAARRPTVLLRGGVNFAEPAQRGGARGERNL